MKANLDFHLNKQKAITAELAGFNGRSGFLSFARLIFFVGAAALIIWGCVSSIMVPVICGILLFAAFLMLCLIHGKVLARVDYLNELDKVNSSYMARIKGDFNELRNIAVKDQKRAEDIGLAKNRLYGKDFEEPEHDYCCDLDLFGKKSLFSLFNVSENVLNPTEFEPVK